MITNRIEATLGNIIDKHVNDAFSSSDHVGETNDVNATSSADIGVQNKLAQTIGDDIMKTKE